MTIDDPGGPSGPGGEQSPRGRPARSSRHDLARYTSLFAARTSVMKSSAMRDLMALTEREEVISLAGGLPDTSTFPAEEFAKVMAHVAAKSTAKALQYGPTEGMAITKDAILTVMAAEGMDPDPEDILVTTGGQQVIDLVCKTFLDPGDVVIAEAPTYPGAVPTFSSYEAEVIQIDMDGDGMRIDLLEETLDALARQGRRPKFIYTIPNFHNPGGVTMSLPRRRRLVQVARERELMILEDNPYGLLRYEGEPLPTLYTLEGGEFVMYLGTFSKILSPGIRTGWTVAPRPVLAKLRIGKSAADLCSSSMTQFFVAEYFASGRWPQYMDSLRDLYRIRRDVMVEALGQHLPAEATWTHPQGGLFLWATLPDGMDTTDLLAKALSRNVAFVPGRAAYLDGRGGTSLRLNFSGVSEDRIREGVRRIGDVVAGQLDLLGRLTGPWAGGSDAPAAGPPAPPAAPPPDLADVLHLPRRGTDDAQRRHGA